MMQTYLVYAILVALALDVVTTLYAFKTGGFHEGNNWLGLRSLIERIGAVPALVITHVGGGLLVFFTGQMWSDVARIVVAAGLWVVVARNLYEVWKYR